MASFVRTVFVVFMTKSFGCFAEHGSSKAIEASKIIVLKVATAKLFFDARRSRKRQTNMKFCCSGWSLRGASLKRKKDNVHRILRVSRKEV